MEIWIYEEADSRDDRCVDREDAMELVLSHAPKILSAREVWPLGRLIAPTHDGRKVRGKGIVR